MKFLDKNKKTTIQDEAKYLYIDNGVILRKYKDNALDLPVFNIKAEFGDVRGIISNKDTLINYLQKNIKPNWWKLIGWKQDSSYMFKIGEWGNKQYEYNIGEEPQQSEIITLSKALNTLSDDLIFDGELANKKDLVNTNIKPSDIVAEFFTDEYEKQKILYSDELGIILDLRGNKENISGNVFDCLYRYSGNNVVKLNELLTSLGIEGVDIENDIYYIYEINQSNKLEFRNDGVYLIKSSGEGEVEQAIIDKPLKLTGWYETNYDIFAKAFTDISRKYYEFEGDIVFSYFSNPDAFNRRMGAMGLRMMASNKVHQLFYSALDKWIEDGKIKQKFTINMNGIDLERKTFAHGGELLYNDSKDEYKIFSNKYVINKNAEQISIKEAKEILSGYFKKPFQDVLFLWFLGAFLKKDLFRLGVKTPLMLVVGFTESGKTELILTLMKLFGYGTVPKQVDNETIQPRVITLEASKEHAILKELGDYAPVFFDEFTGEVDKGIEDIFRGVYNEQTVKKGKPDQTVMIYKLVSPIIIGGEKSPHYMSVINRSLYVQLDKRYHIPKQEYIKKKKALANKVILDDLWNTVKNKDLKKYIEGYELGDGRVEQNYNWLRLVNNIYGKIYTDEEMDNIISLCKDVQKKLIEGNDELKNFLIDLILFGKKEQNIGVFTNENDDVVIDLYVPTENQKYHAVMEIKNLVGDDDESVRNIHINVSKLLREKKTETEWIIKHLVRYMRNYRNKVWQGFLYELIEI